MIFNVYLSLTTFQCNVNSSVSVGKGEKESFDGENEKSRVGVKC